MRLSGAANTKNIVGTSYVPLIAAALRGAFRKALVTLRTWHWRVRTRRQILTLGDRMFADIGVSGVDASREAAKPFWQA